MKIILEKIKGQAINEKNKKQIIPIHPIIFPNQSKSTKSSKSTATTAKWSNSKTTK